MAKIESKLNESCLESCEKVEKESSKQITGDLQEDPLKNLPRKSLTSDDNSDGRTAFFKTKKKENTLSAIPLFGSAADVDPDASVEEDNVELQIHASYESLLEDTGENQKKGILASVPEISKWELDENHVTDPHPKSSVTDAKSPEFPAKVTREVLKRAENAIFKKAVNAIREPPKKVFGEVQN